MYRDKNLDSGLYIIEQRKKNIESATIKGKELIKAFENFLSLRGYIIKKSKDHSFAFKLYSTVIKIHLEYQFNVDNRSERTGKINAYINGSDEELVSISTFSFDYIGNIESKYTKAEFTDYFIIAIEAGFIKYAIENELNIRLK